MKVALELDEEQARIVADACEFYARILVGQFGEIIYRTLDKQLPVSDYCDRREAAQCELFKAREYIYPDLHGVGHSYGLGKFVDADKSFDVYQVLRQVLHPAVFSSPYSMYKLPKCYEVDEGEDERR